YDYYNAFMYETEVIKLLEDLFRRMNPVIMAGGSGLYINAVCHGIDDIPTVEPAVRQEMKELYAWEGIEGLRSLLKKVDPEYYKKADLRNPKRLLKALEITVQAGRPYSSFLTQTRKQRPFRILKAGLDLPREELYDRINRRVDRMIETGLMEEARRLYPHRNTNALNTVGYKELFDYFDKKISLDEAITRIKANTRKYARKQLTWFRKDPDIRWFHPEEKDKIIEWIESSI
ncbi:MAG TPA: tRNA (adenosine(37)-N6)-dimethylallyltransferase MiaA, partial [Bacteroidetes bacterium]|nr:tRNA (adenosine(37)-N6)-dimethylallyltransferase MiaA [Bacteroidota bacterium]